MPTKQKSRGAKKGAKTQTKVVVKTGVKTSTLVALAWAVAFASMGMAASAVTPTPAKHLIGSFTETVHVLQSDYIASTNPTHIKTHKVKREGRFAFYIQTAKKSAQVKNRRYAFSLINYPQGSEPANNTTVPSSATITQLARRAQWGIATKLSWTPPTAQRTSYVDIIGFTGVANSRGQVVQADDYAIIRLKLQEPETPSARNTISVVKNIAFADRNSSNPTGVANQTNVKIASFIIQGSRSEAVDITRVALKDAPNGPVVGANFQNLKIMRNNTPIGHTIGTLNNGVSTNPYTFDPSPALRIARDESFIVDVYADIKSNPTTSATLLNPVIAVDAIYATGFDTGSDSSNESDVNLQTGYIVNNGTLRVTVDANTPVSQQLVMGSTRVPLATFQITAGIAEPVNLDEIVISDLLRGEARDLATLKNIRLVDEQGAQMGTTIGSLYAIGSSTAFARFNFVNGPETIAAGQTKRFTVEADITNFLESGVPKTGQQHQIFLAAYDYDPQTSGNQPSIRASGAASGASLGQNAITYGEQESVNTGQHANTMTIYRTKLGLRWAADTPSRAVNGASEQTVAKIVVSNTANVGSYDATLITLDVTLNGTFRHTEPRRVRAYKDAIVSANQVAENTWAAGSTYEGSTGFESSNRIFNDTLIAAGASRTFIITADTTDATINSRLTVRVNQGQVVWSDGILTNIKEVNSIPLSPEVQTLTY
ncbi:MAG: hypothetical protein UX39_C0002G0028 [Candidatus Magasanikbacteria bacterium GW2011_GWA2_46_17]|uniref:Uncharacterized protein n=1 Tax=Candidatus Magasanikbacteria bacterium GW2011_GWA2_46_17 TaxID=1619042 RepID=A0A0G1P2X5_9BACT|nr:MAG: hypothetical protein UX39_C0002G0028 [Candidatus Magasanikbacteria bacterium GW2011_GWA2_46_17]HBF67174.1 hypothetical protein [Candidatus Magasanikbacteria bacterium]